MKNIKLVSLSLFVLLTQVNFIHAQMRGQNQSRSNSDEKQPPFVVEDAAGFIKFDANKVIKKIKVKKDKSKKEVSKLVQGYNHSLDKIKFLNSVLLNEVKQFVEEKKMEAVLNKDKQMMKSVKNNATSRLLPIQAQISEEQRMLSTNLKKVLTKKQYKRWKKYLEKRKESLKPIPLSGPRVNAAKQGAMRNGTSGRHRRSY